MKDATKSGKTVLIVGSTGYIGNAVVAESVRQGHDTIAVTRSLQDDDRFSGAEVVVADVTDPASLAKAFNRKIDIVISTLACRSGKPQDFDDIDYKATLNVLNAAQENGTRQFILLSAICVRKPDLPLQLAKLKMEDALIRSGMNYSIVRPTAYFWVFEGQNKLVQKGKSAFLIGSGEQATHNPIAKEDLAEYLVGCADNSERMNRVFIIGGPEVPDNVITYKDYLTMASETYGTEPKLINVPGWMFVAVIRTTKFIGIFWRKIGVFSEFLKIVHYYMENDMRAPGYGSRTIKQHLTDSLKEAQT